MSSKTKGCVMSCDTNIEFIEFWLEKGLTMEEIEIKMEEVDGDISFDDYLEEEV
jgi:hypothetical protein